MIAFFEVITTSAPHIYHSALPLSPSTSIVHDRYKEYAHPLARVVWGAPTSWEPSVAAMYGDCWVEAIAWSPCNRFTAVARRESNMVELLDAVTLELLDVFQAPGGPGHHIPSKVDFSPDGRLLTLCISGRITTWDLQTGGKAADFPTERGSILSTTYSIDGRFFGLLIGVPSGRGPGITAYDLLLGTCKGHFPAGHIIPPIWTHGGCIRFVTVKDRSITISEVGFDLAHAPIEVESFPAPDRIVRAHYYLFLPALSRLAFVLSNWTDVVWIEVWDARYSRSLLKCTENWPFQMSFSTDGHLFAYMANWGREIYVWKESATGYELHQRLPPPSLDVQRLVLSPSGRTIIVAGRPIYLLSTAGPAHPLSSISALSVTPFILAFSLDGLLAATAREKEGIITVVNLKSGDCRLAVRTGMEICGLGVTGSTLIAADDRRVVAWNIPMGDDVFNVRANINDSVLTTFLNLQRMSDRNSFTSISISPGHNRIAAVGCFAGHARLSIYDISTGKRLREIGVESMETP